MANITVSPTRMELTRLKGKLRTAQRGHKLLKDKRDELMKQFLETVREVRALRAEVEEELMRVHGAFTVASALMSSEAMEQALLYPKQSVVLAQTTQNIMSVNVPVYDFQTQTRSDSDIYPYGFAATSGELDTAVDALGKVFRKLLKLAEIEKSAQLMAEEIEKTRRRVNALEYVMIPNTQEAIRYINMKLDENDRATTIRLMKVKDMILKESLEEKRAETARAIRTFGDSSEAPSEV
ncbi:V-type ATP synthase subunit D [uncultured Oscillibacter sp.]|uniref:V-type ATP synthase subunit D n=1 Tax=uncultured Oscillibacter sp. TaxID=876091 RepID=UPI00266F8D28|nr:V-type ATP synthase subunit D [uncultured Oscillibacter sp.]